MITLDTGQSDKHYRGFPGWYRAEVSNLPSQQPFCLSKFFMVLQSQEKQLTIVLITSLEPNNLKNIYVLTV